MVKCCEEFDEELDDGTVFSIMSVVPFTDKPCNAVYILNDSGHHGFWKIDYCPFCGQKINLTSEKS